VGRVLIFFIGWVPFPIQKEPAEEGHRENSVTFYNDRDSLFTQADKEFSEIATNKARQKDLSSVASDVKETRGEDLSQSVCSSTRSSSRSTTFS
jgi:hypothetical protein